LEHEKMSVINLSAVLLFLHIFVLVSLLFVFTLHLLSQVSVVAYILDKSTPFKRNVFPSFPIDIFPVSLLLVRSHQ